MEMTRTIATTVPPTTLATIIPTVVPTGPFVSILRDFSGRSLWVVIVVGVTVSSGGVADRVLWLAVFRIVVMARIVDVRVGGVWVLRVCGFFEV